RQADGNPDMSLVSTSSVERQNLNIRMGNGRFTRLTNAFSRMATMLPYLLSITFMHHNFVGIHQSLKLTLAKAGIAAAPSTIGHKFDLLPLFVYNTRPVKAGLD